MKALSLWQPWASAMSLGLKRVETRHWFTSYRGPMAIHAAKRWTADERDLHQVEVDAGRMPATLPLGAIVAIGRLIAIRPTEYFLGKGLSPLEEQWGNYGPRRFGWVFDDIRPLEAPIPYRGGQGIFEVPEEAFADGYVQPPLPSVPPGCEADADSQSTGLAAPVNDEPISFGEGSSAEELDALVRRYETLIDDGRAIAEDKREVRREAKDAGFDWATIAAVIKRRELEPAAVIEADQLLETYEAALGCGAAAAGVLSTTRNADGQFEVKMVAAPAGAGKLTKAAKAQRDAIALAELAQRARADDR